MTVTAPRALAQLAAVLILILGSSLAVALLACAIVTLDNPLGAWIVATEIFTAVTT